MPGRGCRRARANPRLYPEYHPAPGETAMRAQGNKEFWLAALRTEDPPLRTAVIEAGPDAPVPSCPEWTVGQLIGHLTTQYRWISGHVGRGVTTPPEEPHAPGLDVATVAEFDAAFADLLTCFDALDP